MPHESLDQMLSSLDDTARRFHQAGGDAMRKVVIAPTTPFYSSTPDELRDMLRAAESLSTSVDQGVAQPMRKGAF